MRAWFVPPLVIPIFVVLMVVAFATYQARIPPMVPYFAVQWV